MFEFINSNVSWDSQQNIPGYAVSVDTSGASPVVTQIAARDGSIWTKYARTPMQGYGNAYTNSNTWNMQANSGTGAIVNGIIPEIYFANSRALKLNGGWALDISTLDITAPAGERTNFAKCILGESYAVSADQFAASAVGDKGYLSADGGITTTAPSDAGTYLCFVVKEIAPVTEGAWAAAQNRVIFEVTADTIS